MMNIVKSGPISREYLFRANLELLPRDRSLVSSESCFTRNTPHMIEEGEAVIIEVTPRIFVGWGFKE